jgi:hypothetical protein
MLTVADGSNEGVGIPDAMGIPVGNGLGEGIVVGDGAGDGVELSVGVNATGSIAPFGRFCSKPR